MKKLFMFAMMLMVAASASAATYTFGWEDGTSTILGNYGDIIATNVSDIVYEGAYALKLEDAAASGTPQAYACWIRGLQDGDEIYASVARYDVAPGDTAPNGRIWGHWNDDPLDVSGYNGSASGNADYGLGEGWDITDYTWIVEAGHTGLIIELRTYSVPGDTVWFDNLTVIVPDRDGIEVEFPGGYVPVDNTTFSQLKALY